MSLLIGLQTSRIHHFKMHYFFQLLYILVRTILAQYKGNISTITFYDILGKILYAMDKAFQMLQEYVTLMDKLWDFKSNEPNYKR
jgi:hypothetical protein